MRHLKAINRKATMVEETVTNDVVGLQGPGGPGPHIPLGCSFVFSPGWEADSSGGTAGLCQPVERDLFDCYLTCFWPAHVPDHYNHAPEWTGKCASAQKDWRNIDLIFPMSLARVFLLCVAAAAPLAAQTAPSGGNGTFYITTYSRATYVIPESTMTVAHRLPFDAGLPIGATLTADRKRLYVEDAHFERFRVYDLATRALVDSFQLSSGATKVRIVGMGVDPKERFAVFLIKSTARKPDRFEIGKTTLVRYDLVKHAVTDTIPWPKNQEREFAGFQFSPDGKYMYLFGEDILVYETEKFTVVDRWLLSQPLQPGMGQFGFGFPESFYEEPGYYTGLFRMTDPVQNRRIMGVARVNLQAKSVEFYALGPDEPVGFTLAPDRKKAYGLKQRVGAYEFWTFDLEGKRVAGRTPFKGRPRMQLLTSTNGKLLYIAGAGSTIDIYDAATLAFLRTVTLDSDMIDVLLVP